MIYRKNVSGKERMGRLLAGVAMILCGLFGLQASLLGLLLAGAGAVSVLTAMFGYCPACAAAGRKPIGR
ncbi:YgaP family membrane protein [Noviherbaspirillum saxi]|uniref:DUF2892 domain-containing protein n=1 Tax=Noviherbaspirillum saxi TaxID=2320863 RepID=A0A3A3FI32_9BURK|nr:DUF2892 domain-containing protein [Noviherbaspirillum saxi]RJF92048.1 DUF2892 domain-containing protein [Noviherbaspirillum saxi]